MPKNSWIGGMDTSIEATLTRRAVAEHVRVTASKITVVLEDGREISIPLAEFPELQRASKAQQANWEITALGTAVYWPDIDEELALAGMLGISESAIEEAAGFTVHDH